MNYDRTYDAKDIEMESLVGRKIISALINEEKDAIALETDDGPYYLRWEGDCCASCFIAHFNGAEFLVGATIQSIETAEWTDQSRDDENYDVVQTMGTKITTDKGHIDIETRLEHNGYYGGSINVSKQGYIDAYSCFIKVENVNIPLKDF